MNYRLILLSAHVEYKVTNTNLAIAVQLVHLLLAAYFFFSFHQENPVLTRFELGGGERKPPTRHDACAF